jgi:hypothetical protein
MYSELTNNAPLYSYLPTLTGQVSYTPVVIQFVPSLLNSDGSPVYKKDIQKGFNYYLRISCPESNKLGTLATLPESYHIEVPEDGLVRLQLVPTTTLLPKGYYIVDYFRSNSKKPLLTQHWAVPELSPTAKSSYSFTYEKSTTVLPLDVWEVLSINAAGTALVDNWRTIYNNIFWDVPEPLVGTPMTVVYKQALTLYDILLPQTPAHDRNRVRY